MDIVVSLILNFFISAEINLEFNFFYHSTLNNMMTASGGANKAIAAKPSRQIALNVKYKLRSEEKYSQHLTRCKKKRKEKRRTFLNNKDPDVANSGGQRGKSGGRRKGGRGEVTRHKRREADLFSGMS